MEIISKSETFKMFLPELENTCCNGIVDAMNIIIGFEPEEHDLYLTMLIISAENKNKIEREEWIQRNIDAGNYESIEFLQHLCDTVPLKK